MDLEVENGHLAERGSMSISEMLERWRALEAVVMAQPALPADAARHCHDALMILESDIIDTPSGTSADLIAKLELAIEFLRDSDGVRSHEYVLFRFLAEDRNQLRQREFGQSVERQAA